MRRIAQVVGSIVLIVLVLLVGLPLMVKANDFRPRLQAELSKALGREVKIGNLKLAILSGGVTADDLAIADDESFSRTPFVHANSLNIGVKLVPLIFSRKLNVTQIAIDRPEIMLIQTASGNWNFSKLGSQTTDSGATPPKPPGASPPANNGLDLSIQMVKISNGRVTIGRVGSRSKPLVLDHLNIALSNFSAASEMPFSLAAEVAGQGVIKIEGTAGPIPADVVLTPVHVTLKVTHLDLSNSGLVDPALGLAGIVTVDGSAVSDGKSLGLTGDVKAVKLKLVKGGSAATRPVEFGFALMHGLKTRAGFLNRGDLHVGSASAKLTGTYAPQGDDTILSADLAGPEMPVLELEGILPALNIVLPAGSTLQGGTANAKVHLAGPTDRLVATGFLGLNGTRLVGFNLGSKMSVIQNLAGLGGGPNTEIQTLSSKVRASAEGDVSLEEIKLIVPAIGELDGSGTVSPTNALDFKMSVTVHANGVLAAVGSAPIPFLVRGTSINPVIEPDMKGLAVREVEQYGGQAGKAASGLIKELFGKKKGK